MKVQGAAMLIRWWDGPPVIVLVPTSEAICIRNEKRPVRAICEVPGGAVRGFPLTRKRKQFLLQQGMNPGLIDSGRVFDVSDTLASQFQRESEVVASLAERCGLTSDDLDKIQEAKKKLAQYHPTDHTGRRAKRALETLFSSKAHTKEAGRPKRISAEERRELRQRANKMEVAGQNRSDIVAQFSEEYELRPSYVRRILEDHSKAEE
jgi:hypothetical protein